MEHVETRLYQNWQIQASWTQISTHGFTRNFAPHWLLPSEYRAFRQNCPTNLHGYQQLCLALVIPCAFFEPWPARDYSSTVSFDDLTGVGIMPEFAAIFRSEKSDVPGWWFGTWSLFFHILGIILPTDELIFFRGVGIPPTSNFFLKVQSDLGLPATSKTGCAKSSETRAGRCHCRLW